MNSARRVALALLAAATASCGGGDGITVTSHVASVSVAPSSSNIAPGATVQLTATPTDATGNVLTGLATTWTSSNAAAATVASGLVTGVAAGFASITATIGGVSGTASINVAAPTFNLTVTGAGNGNGFVTAPAAATTPALNCAIATGVAGATCTANYTAAGTLITLTATAVAGSTFTGWSNACTGTAPCVVTMSQARTAVATFASNGGDPCAPVTLPFPSAVNGAVASGGCVVGGAPAAVYRFTATGNGGVTFNVTSGFPSTLEVMSDPPGNNVALVSTLTPPSLTGEWMLPPGSYQLRVSAQSSNGTFTITGTATNGATNNGSGCTSGVPLRLFVVGATYTGQTLGAGDCRETDQSFADFFYIRSLKGCTITMTPTGFNAFLAINDAITGANITVKDAGLVGVAESVTLAACSNNGSPIEIEANTFAAGETGAYTLTITITGGGSIVAGTQPASDGAMLPGVIDTRRILDLLKLRSRKPPPQ